LSKKIKLSVITTSWNRAEYLPRVFDSLVSQDFPSMEWIICDDASDDNTFDIVKNVSNSSPFSIKYIKSNKRIGKVVLDNQAIKEAKGDFVIWCDSDDYFAHNAIKKLFKSWDSANRTVKNEAFGVIGLCDDNLGITMSTFNCGSSQEVNFNDLFQLYGYSGDHCLLIKTSVMKNNLFPEVDLVIPEDVVYTKIGKSKVILCESTVLHKEYMSKNHLSFRGKYEYTRGRAHRLGIVKKHLNQYDSCIYPTEHVFKGYTKKISHFLYNGNYISKKHSYLISFFRFCIHGDITFHKALNIWPYKLNKLVSYSVYTLSLILSYIDSIKGRVDKTHLIFDKSIHKYSLDIMMMKH